MKKLFIKYCSVLLASFAIIACNGTKQDLGTGAGLLVGGLIGSQFGSGSGKIAATIIGAGAGALVGRAIGHHLDEKDKQIVAHKSQSALESAPTNKSVPWKNPDNGHSGSITPTKTYQNDTGQYCREYTQTVNIGGKAEKAYGRACRQPDGSWQVVQ